MLLNQEQVESIKSRQITFVRNCRVVEKYNSFEKVFDFLEQNDVAVRIRNPNINPQNNIVWLTRSTVFSVDSCERDPEIFAIQDLIFKLFYTDNSVRLQNSHIFFSITSGMSNEHIDEEDVHLIGLFGETIYRVYDNLNNTHEDYVINPGDYLFIPCGIKHRSISMSKRAVLSVGFYLTNPQ